MDTRTTYLRNKLFIFLSKFLIVGLASLLVAFFWFLLVNKPLNELTVIILAAIGASISVGVWSYFNKDSGKQSDIEPVEQSYLIASPAVAWTTMAATVVCVVPSDAPVKPTVSVNQIYKVNDSSLYVP